MYKVVLIFLCCCNVLFANSNANSIAKELSILLQEPTYNLNLVQIKKILTTYVAKDEIEGIEFYEEFDKVNKPTFDLIDKNTNKNDYRKQNVDILHLLTKEPIGRIVIYFKSRNILFTKSERQYIENKKIIKICVHKDTEPFVIVSKNNKVEGISIEFLDQISKKINIDFEMVVSDNLDQNIKKIKNAKCDIFPVILTKPNIHKFLIPTIPFASDNIVLVTKINEPYVLNLNSLKDKKIAIQKGAKNLAKYINTIYPNIELEEINNTNLSRVISGEFYGSIGASYGLVYKLSNQYFNELKIMSKIGDKKVNGSFGITTREPILVGIFNKAINDIVDKEKQKILNGWLNVIVEKQFDYILFWQVTGMFFILFIVGLLFVLILKNNNKKLINLLNSTIEAVAIFKYGKLVEANQQLLDMYGYDTQKEILGKNILDFVDEKQHPFVKEQLTISREPYELNMIRKNGTIFPSLARGTQIDENTRISNILDITELKSAQKKLEILNKSLKYEVENEVAKNREKDKLMLHQSRLAQMGEMISMIAHQWRQPLAAISSTSAAISLKAKLNKLDENTTIKLTDKISEYSQHLSLTIDDFRDFFKPNKDKSDITYDELLQSVLNIIEIPINHQKIKLIKEFNSKQTFNTYPNEIKQVILNIIKNAEDVLMEKEIENPIITIKTKDNILTIGDNAGGVSKDIIDKIFDPYFSTKTQKNGTGLGLYMSKTIIEEHCAGQLCISNDKDGAVFQIILNENNN